MKKVCTLILAIITTIGVANGSIQIGDLYYSLNPTTLTAEVTSNPSKYSGDIVIPSSVIYEGNTYDVTSIGNAAFENCTGLTSIKIPNSVTYIEYSAFYGCTGLPVIDNIRYADTYLVEVIDKTLSTYKIKDGTKWIGYIAFYQCTNLTNITLPNSVTTIDHYAFYGCTSLINLNLPNSVTNLRYHAFHDCTGLKNISFSSNLTIIGQNCFEGCTGLTNIQLPNSLTTIEKNAFLGCTGLTNIKFPNSVTTIEEHAFSGCSGLTSITFGYYVIEIGNGAFAGCPNIVEIFDYAIAPQPINPIFENIYSSVPLYVPARSVEFYKKAPIWKIFTNILPLPDDTAGTEGEYTIQYLDNNSATLLDETIYLHLPGAPHIEGFTFLGWRPVASLIDNKTIQIEAVYEAENPSAAPEVIVNPSNTAHKLIRNGNVYILTDNKTYTITGQQVQ